MHVTGFSGFPYETLFFALWFFISFLFFSPKFIVSLFLCFLFHSFSYFHFSFYFYFSKYFELKNQSQFRSGVDVKPNSIYSTKISIGKGQIKFWRYLKKMIAKDFWNGNHTMTLLCSEFTERHNHHKPHLTSLNWCCWNIRRGLLKRELEIMDLLKTQKLDLLFLVET